MAFIYKGLHYKWKPRGLSLCALFALKNVLREFELEAHIKKNQEILYLKNPKFQCLLKNKIA